MTIKKVYKIVKSENRGKIAVAERDILPGELIVSEKVPILHYTKEFLFKFKKYPPQFEIAMASYSTFKNVLSTEAKLKFSTLYGPTTGFWAEELRKFANSMVKKNKEDMTVDDVEMFVKVGQVVRLNMFGVDEGGQAVFEELTRFAHSCAANCSYSVKGKHMYSHATRHISAGEELTISYLSGRDIEPTHERRYKYLQTKEFTCHCSRCDALGDDTRQFDCVDPKCKGVMMVCHPINDWENLNPAMSYTGVEYVEPHLLPCTVCHKTAPADYQTKMFALETKMLDLGPRFAQRFNDMMDAHQYNAMSAFLKEQQALKIPRRHSAALPFLKTEMRTKHSMFIQQGILLTSLVQAAVKEYISALENIFPYAHSTLSEELNFVVSICSKFCTTPVFPPQQERDLCRKALQMFLMMYGRTMRDADTDEVMCKSHVRLPASPSTEVCAFCEESPLRAALTLSRCGRCKQVAYCSVECQKAHWKVHKNSCKKAV